MIFMMSFSMLLPELPEYITQLGGKDYIGYVVGLFTVSAGLSRFWSGRLADKIGRVRIILFGTFVTAICGFLYIYTTSIALFLGLRLIHGLSTGWRPIGATAMLTDITPPGRIGEAGSTGMALGPAFGSLLKEEVSYDAMFIASSVCGVIAILLSLRLKESHSSPQKLELSDLNILKGKVLDFSAKHAMWVTLFETFAFGVVITVSPLLVGGLGFKYKGLFNLTFVFASMAMRVFAGKASDKYGRKLLLTIGVSTLIIALIVMGFSTSKSLVILGGILYGFSIGLNRPTTFAWTVDLARPGKLGLALATMLLALEIGIGSGAFISGSMYDGTPSSVHNAFFLAAGVSVFALLYLLIFVREERP
jgi:MFS family permease